MTPAFISPEPAWTSGTQNTVSWTAVANATTYTVQCDEAADFATPRATAGVSSPTLSHTFTALADGQTYWYRVRSENAIGPGGWSPPTSSTQDATSPTTPGTPTDAGAFTSSTSVRFNWTAATDPGTTPSGIASYDLEVGTAPGGTDVFDANVGNVLTRTVTGINGQTLYARARARDGAGNIGAWSLDSDGIGIDTVRPQLTGAAAVNSTVLNITFSKGVVNADAAANYAVTGGLQILQATRLSATQYRLQTTPQTPGFNYTITAGGAIRDLAGNTMDSTARSRPFAGGGSTSVRTWELYR